MQQKKDYDANRSHRNGASSEIYTSNAGKSDLNGAVAVENDVFLVVVLQTYKLFIPTFFSSINTRHVLMWINCKIIHKCQHSVVSVMLQPFKKCIYIYISSNALTLWNVCIKFGLFLDSLNGTVQIFLHVCFITFMPHKFASLIGIARTAPG